MPSSSAGSVIPALPRTFSATPVSSPPSLCLSPHRNSAIGHVSPRPEPPQLAVAATSTCACPHPRGCPLRSARANPRRVGPPPVHLGRAPALRLLPPNRRTAAAATAIVPTSRAARTPCPCPRRRCSPPAADQAPRRYSHCFHACDPPPPVHNRLRLPLLSLLAVTPAHTICAPRGLGCELTRGPSVANLVAGATACRPRPGDSLHSMRHAKGVRTHPCALWSGGRSRILVRFSASPPRERSRGLPMRRCQRGRPRPPPGSLPCGPRGPAGPVDPVNG